MFLVYANSINSRQGLWEEIQNAVNFISRQSDKFGDIRNVLIKKITTWRESLHHIWATPGPRVGFGSPPASIRPARD